MEVIKYILINIFATLLRFIPIPTETGLIEIGNPDEDSPVFLTCNYLLTVERVKRALKKLDCYLLIANSDGINVWCSAAGGHFTNYDVVSILKTSGIERLVNHRKVILPQLAAVGIEAQVIKQKTGWDIIWGPVYAEDIPLFIEKNLKKIPKMRVVKFPLMQRIEVAIMWAFPLSVMVSLFTFLFWRYMLLPLTILIWGLPFMIFISFPLYSRWLNPQKRELAFSKYTIVFDFSRIPLILWGIFLCGLIFSCILFHYFSLGFILRWGIASLFIILLVSIDLMGSTPVFKSGLHEDRFLRVVLDEEKCTGCGICIEVCPRNCYRMDKARRMVSVPDASFCIQCGACIVQCPVDALYFRAPSGKIISPEVIREFKLNFLGKRLHK